MKHRLFFGILGFCLLLYPQVISCGTPNTADRTVQLNALSDQSLTAFEEVSRFSIPYGTDKESTLGFQPGGNETQRLAPNAFTVAEDGRITVHDPVHRKVWVSQKSGDGAISLRAEGPYQYAAVAALKDQSRKNDAVKVEKTGADTADVSYNRDGLESSVRLEFDGPLASIQISGVNKGGDAFLLIERFVEMGSLVVSREVLVLAATGEIKARLRIDDTPAAPPVVEFQLAPDGSLYQMIPNESSVIFVRFEVK